MIKVLHILGVVLFLGNIIISSLWRHLANRAEDKAVHKFSIKLIQRTDIFFSVPGIILIAVTGHMLAPGSGGIGAHGWIYHSYALLTVSALIWVAGLMPIQKRQLRLIEESHSLKEAGIRYKTLNRWWTILGTIAAVLPLIALYLMVVRPA
ncbi:MAG: DUF2269 family protein [Candidatus Marinimicrobia bacterium]|jgi:uncharacterized membrane protein|nr:DUF2269 family protein [Candidatus Neomarinimicrobiota bacterium]MBT3574681.1 DUF2269 family protein [Candidatus Neomarinimicrobiota bacterium]MBT3681145.1 DUF2269 family protein [Candidatus Neomarinimicrobiota bacterium]MBT3951700.1 DUF2269 family protein [Candidatus Neomarinimicrobiota bacterium]MBT4252531.1 DUF2269 family protein [Candidatus Neomarinimicrobiota bacterium]